MKVSILIPRNGKKRRKRVHIDTDTLSESAFQEIVRAGVAKLLKNKPKRHR